MIDLQAYMESGVIEAYCLGQLNFAEMRELERIAGRYAEIRAEIVRTNAVLRESGAKTPALQARKENIMHLLRQLDQEQNMTLDNLPLLTPYSDYRKWMTVVDGLQPTHHVGGLHFCILQETSDLLQTLTWLDDSLQEDGHAPDEFQESFLVLEGECECTIGGKIVHFGSGGYLVIPENVPHTIRNLRPGQPLLGIIQRYRAAA